MQRFIILCGALVLMSLPCLAQIKRNTDPERTRIIAAIERHDAILQDLLETHEKCFNEKSKGVEAYYCPLFDEKLNQTPIEFFTTYPGLPSPSIKVPPEEARRLANAIFYNIWAGYEHARRKALDMAVPK